MPKTFNKVFYALKNPLDCLLYAKELVGSEINSSADGMVCIVLPKHIDPSRFEFLLLQDAECFSGVEIQGISSLPRRTLSSKGYFNVPPRVDQVELSEHFHNRLPRSLSRPLLNAVLELKQADFEHDYLKFLFEKRKDKEGTILLEVFDEYQRFLKTKGLFDDANCKKLFVEEALRPGSKLINSDSVYIFAGFNEFSSYDIDIIKTISATASKTFVVSPAIMNMDIEYSKLLAENFTSMGFEVVNVKDDRARPSRTHEFSSINDEVHYISQNLKQGIMYAVSDVDTYYSLLRYQLGVDAVSISTAMRLDRTTYLNVMSTILTLNSTGWIYSDVVKVLNFSPLWKDDEAVLKFIDKASNEMTLPRGQKYWQELAAEYGNSEISVFFKTVVEKVPSSATPRTFENVLKTICKDKEGLEFDSVMNLVFRVAGCLEPRPITAENFVRKLYNHAEENYVLKGPISFKPFNVALASLASANIYKNVWFAGMNQDAFAQIGTEDVVMNDSLILEYRSEGFLYPTSKESSAIASKIIKDASNGADSSFLSNLSETGAVADFLKDAENTKHKKQMTMVLNGAFSELQPKEIELKQPGFDALSATLISSYIKCHYILLAEKILKAGKDESDDFVLNPMDGGSILHKAMELLLPRKLKGEAFDIEAELENILSSGEFKQLSHHPLRKVFIKYYSSIVENALNEESQFMQEEGLELFERETMFNVKLDVTGDVPIKGRVDRIDVDKTNKKLYIADYKTSTMPNGVDIKSGDDIQLALYIMAMATKYPDYDLGGYYISIKKLERTNMELLSLDEARNIFSVNGSKAVQGIKAGIYTPKPLDPATCEKCDYRRCCGAV